jgi:hypothetical protein
LDRHGRRGNGNEEETSFWTLTSVQVEKLDGVERVIVSAALVWVRYVRGALVVFPTAKGVNVADMK